MGHYPWVRNFLAGLMLLVAAVATVAASVAYVAHETVLDPSRAGDVLSAAADSPQVRDEILSRALPGYDQLPAQYRDQVGAIIGSKPVDRALNRVRVDASGTVHVAGVRDSVVQTLRDHGQGTLASQLQALGGVDSFKLPSNIASRYQDARATTWTVATTGALVAGVLFLLALLVARGRRGALATIGLILLGSVGATLLLWSQLPSVVSRFTDNPYALAAAAAGDNTVPTAVSVLMPVIIAGAVVLVVSLVWPRSRRT